MNIPRSNASERRVEVVRNTVSETRMRSEPFPVPVSFTSGLISGLVLGMVLPFGGFQLLQDISPEFPSAAHSILS